MSAGTEKPTNRFWLRLLAISFSGLFLAISPWEIFFPQTSPLSVNGPTTVNRIFLVLCRVPTEVGIALMIAAVIAWLVDYAAEQRLLEDFAENVSAHVIGRLLPLDLRESIFDYLQNPIVRTKLNILYAIKDLPGHKGFVELRVDGGSDVENRSGVARSWDFTCSVDHTCCPSVGKSRLTGVSVTELSNHDKTTIFECKERQLKKSPDVVKNESSQTFKKKINLASGPEGDRPVHHCHFQSIQCHRDNSVVSFTTRVPVLETTITVIYDKRSFETVLNPSVGHEAFELTELANGREWHIRRPLLDGQGFLLRWRKAVSPRKIPPTTQAQLAVNRGKFKLHPPGSETRTDS